jgi:hypothetical protein
LKIEKALLMVKFLVRNALCARLPIGTFVSLVEAARGGVGKGVRPELGESRRQIHVEGEEAL